MRICPLTRKGENDTTNMACLLLFPSINRDEAGVKALAKLFDKEKIEIREVGDIVRGHLYGESDEFHDLFKEQQKKYDDDEREAAFKMLDKIYDVFGYRPYNRDEEDFDACLIRDRKADYLVTKVLVDWMERHDLR